MSDTSALVPPPRPRRRLQLIAVDRATAAVLEVDLGDTVDVHLVSDPAALRALAGGDR